MMLHAAKISIITPEQITLIQDYQDDLEALLREHDLPVIIDQSPKGKYRVVKTLGLRKCYDKYKNAIHYGSITMQIINGKPTNFLDIEISLDPLLGKVPTGNVNIFPGCP